MSVAWPTLAWNTRQALSLVALDETFPCLTKFASCTGAHKLGFASPGELLTQWSEQVPPAITPVLGQGSFLISGFWRKTEPLVCAAIEVQEHTIQLLEALGTILPAGECVPHWPLLYGLPHAGGPLQAAGKPALVVQGVHALRCGQQGRFHPGDPEEGPTGLFPEGRPI